MLVCKISGHLIKQSPWCGEIREILGGGAYPPLSVAVALDIKPTRAHFHRTFDEIYFVLDGSLTLRFYDAKSHRTWTESLAANELCVIGSGIHHAIIEASPRNRLCVLCVPQFDAADETSSDRI